MKIHELAKEYNQKATDFLKKLQDLGFDFTAHTQSIDDGLADNIRSVLAKAVKAEDPENKKIRELSLMTMLGVYYDLNTGKYHIASFRVYPEEFDKYGILLSKPYASIDHAAQDVNKNSVDAGFYSPSDLEKVRRKRLTSEQK
jgi:hypothetical protein